MGHTILHPRISRVFSLRGYFSGHRFDRTVFSEHLEHLLIREMGGDVLQEHFIVLERGGQEIFVEGGVCHTHTDAHGDDFIRVHICHFEGALGIATNFL